MGNVKAIGYESVAKVLLGALPEIYWCTWRSYIYTIIGC